MAWDRDHGGSSPRRRDEPQFLSLPPRSPAPGQDRTGTGGGARQGLHSLTGGEPMPEDCTCLWKGNPGLSFPWNLVVQDLGPGQGP